MDNNSNIRAAARTATAGILKAMAGPGALIQLKDIYEATGATCPTSQNGCRWAILDAKQAGLITKTDTRGLYATL